MKPLDRYLQRWRNGKVRPYLPAGARVLDIGCADGPLFQQFASRIGEGIGIDPDLPKPICGPRYRLIPGRFPKDLPDDGEFDLIAMLAVLEHVPADQLRDLPQQCSRRLRLGGYLVITVPSPVVDRILDVLKATRFLDGMCLEEHHGFDVSQVPVLFSSEELVLVRAARFQLGLNNLFVFQRVARRSG